MRVKEHSIKQLKGHNNELKTKHSKEMNTHIRVIEDLKSKLAAIKDVKKTSATTQTVIRDSEAKISEDIIEQLQCECCEQTMKFTSLIREKDADTKSKFTQQDLVIRDLTSECIRKDSGIQKLTSQMNTYKRLIKDLKLEIAAIKGVKRTNAKTQTITSESKTKMEADIRILTTECSRKDSVIQNLTWQCTRQDIVTNDLMSKCTQNDQMLEAEKRKSDALKATVKELEVTCDALRNELDIKDEAMGKLKLSKEMLTIQVTDEKQLVETDNIALNTEIRALRRNKHRMEAQLARKSLEFLLLKRVMEIELSLKSQIFCQMMFKYNIVKDTFITVLIVLTTVAICLVLTQQISKI